MFPAYDIAVIGAGAMGSAAAYHLSKSGKKILVLDKFSPPHAFGSSHGQTRIIREAYFENPLYVPLVQQAYHLWERLEAESGKNLFLKTGGLMLGHKDQKLFSGTARSAQQYGIAYDFLEQEQLCKKFPILKSDSSTVAMLEKNAGILFPEECIRTHLELAACSSVDFHFNEPVTALQSNNDVVTVTTAQYSYTAQKAIVCNGAWITSLQPALQLPLEVKRQVLFWFSCNGTAARQFLPAAFPVFIWEHAPGKMFYGFPDLGSGIKIAVHHRGQSTTADSINRDVTTAEVTEITELVNCHFNADLNCIASAVCMYTNTPDEHFMIDYHPAHHNIIIVSACSGHGFKFSSAIGKIVCEMALEEPISFDITPFRLQRKFS